MNEKLLQLSDIKRASSDLITQFQSLWRRL